MRISLERACCDTPFVKQRSEQRSEQRPPHTLTRGIAADASYSKGDLLTETDFKNHNDLPLARIKRIMKSDEDVRMISAEAPIVFAKACELFILELTIRSYAYSEFVRRRCFCKEDILLAIRKTKVFDFLAGCML